MSRDGIYTPFKPIESERDFGVEVTDRYKLGQHAKDFIQEPVSAWEDKENGDLLMYGWAFEPDEAYMYLPSHSWSMSKLYHQYSNGSNFRQFWSSHSEYTEPTRVLHHVRHGGDFSNLAEIIYGGYDIELYEVFTDGNGGFCLVERDISSQDSGSFEVVEESDFSMNPAEMVDDFVL